MSEPSPTRTLAEEGARASRAINDTIKRLTAGGANPLMDGFPNYLQAARSGVMFQSEPVFFYLQKFLV